MKYAFTSTALFLCLAAPAHAASPTDKMQLKVTFLGSFGGETEWQRIDNGTKGRRQDTDNLSTVGGTIQFEYPVLRYLTVGANTRFYRWNWEVADNSNIDASFGMDFDAVVRGRYPLMNGRLELSIAMPVGLTVIVPNDDWEAGQVKPEIDLRRRQRRGPWQIGRAEQRRQGSGRQGQRKAPQPELLPEGKFKHYAAVSLINLGAIRDRYQQARLIIGRLATTGRHNIANGLLDRLDPNIGAKIELDKSVVHLHHLAD